MKIVIAGVYNSSEILSGPQKFANRLFNQLCLLNDEAVFIQYFFKWINRSNIFLRWFGKELVKKKPRIIRLGHLRIFLFLIKYQPEIINIVTPERFLIPLFFYKFFLRAKIVVNVHSILRDEIPLTLNKNNKLSRFKDYLYEWLVFRFSDCLVFLSGRQIELAKKYYSLRNKRVEILPNGIDKDFVKNNLFPDRNNELRMVFYNGINSNEHLDRGLNNLLNILNEIKDIDIKLSVIGYEKNNIKTSYNFSVKYIKPMKKSDLLNFLSDKHIFIKSLSFDSFSIMAAECMAFGLIVVISENVGISSYIKNGINGFVYKNYDELKLILSGIKRRNDCENISVHASKIINELSWENVCNQYIKFYGNIKNI